MVKKKSYRGTIRIDGKLIQESFATAGDRDDWYSKMRQQKMRLVAGIEISYHELA